MRVMMSTKNVEDLEPEAVVLWMFEGQEGYHSIEKYTGNIMQKLVQSKVFIGKEKQVYTLHTAKKMEKVILVGLGKEDEISYDKIRIACAVAAKQMKRLKVKHFVLSLVPMLETARKVHAMIEGTHLALYTFHQFKTQDQEQSSVEKYTIVCSEKEKEEAEEAVASAMVVMDAIYKCRDLQNLPSSIATPAMLAREAQRLARQTGMRCKVLDVKELEKRGMHGILAVNRGSSKPAKLVILEWRGGKKKLCLVGKGITFDSGGISLKPADAMDEMKFDMSGGAVVMMSMYAAARLQLPLHLMGIIPLTENMPGGNAYKPGDIITMYNRKTVEVLNTDAEGRMVLADALAFAAEQKPEAILDYATLTGACVVALGGVCAGFFTNDEDIRTQLVDASKRTGEKIWELPLLPEYKEDVKSKIADLKNIGKPREAGATAGAIFLEEFVHGAKWAHLDIAGTAWTTQEQPLCTYGGTGYGVRLTLSFLQHWN